jgi:hypothetical protein
MDINEDGVEVNPSQDSLLSTIKATYDQLSPEHKETVDGLQGLVLEKIGSVDKINTGLVVSAVGLFCFGAAAAARAINNSRSNNPHT